MCYRAEKLVIDVQTDTHIDKHRQRRYSEAKLAQGNNRISFENAISGTHQVRSDQETTADNSRDLWRTL